MAHCTLARLTYVPKVSHLWLGLVCGLGYRFLAVLYEMRHRVFICNLNGTLFNVQPQVLFTLTSLVQLVLHIQDLLSRGG